LVPYTKFSGCSKRLQPMDKIDSLILEIRGQAGIGPGSYP